MTRSWKSRMRSPLTRQNQIGITVAIDIAEHRSADQSNLFQRPVVRGVRHKLATLVAKNPSTWPPRDISPAQRARRRRGPGLRRRLYPRAPTDPGLIRWRRHVLRRLDRGDRTCRTAAPSAQAIFVVREAGKDEAPSRSLVPCDQSRLIARQQLIEWRGAHRFKPTLPIIAKHSHPPALAASDHEIVPSVRIKIEPRQRGSELAQLVRQSG